MARGMTRRTFGRIAAAGTLGYLFTAPATSLARVRGANDRLRFAGIGVGGKGSSDINHAGEHGDVIALCDIDEKFLAPKIRMWKDAKVFFDYRKLFDDSIIKDIDAVVVSTPDHHHALPSVLAMRMGKHVYCQKPLSHTVFEARLMREVARKYKVCTQMGNQGTSENGLRRAVELVQNGTLGDVAEVHVWTNRPVWPQAPEVTADNMPKEAECPKHVHWDEFIGPAPMRSYAVYTPETPRRFGNRLPAYHDFHWRGYWDFGTGAIGDMACHTANMAFMALNLTTPTKVQAEAGDVNDQSCPSYAHVIFDFPARGNMPALKLHWYEGRKDGKKLSPPAELVEKALAIDPNPKRKTRLVDSGSIIVGSKGIMYSPNDYGAEVFIGPAADFEGVQMKTPEKLPESVSRPLEERKVLQKKENDKDVAPDGNDQRQKTEWIRAIRDNKPQTALANFDYASYLTETFLLGNVAIRCGQAFEWDGDAGQVKNCPAAEKFVHMEYRKGWDLLGDKA